MSFDCVRVGCGVLLIFLSVLPFFRSGDADTSIGMSAAAFLFAQRPAVLWGEKVSSNSSRFNTAGLGWGSRPAGFQVTLSSAVEWYHSVVRRFELAVFQRVMKGRSGSFARASGRQAKAQRWVASSFGTMCAQDDSRGGAAVLCSAGYSNSGVIPVHGGTPSSEGLLACRGQGRVGSVGAGGGGRGCVASASPVQEGYPAAKAC